MQHSVFKLPRASAWISSLLREAYLHLSLLHIHVQPGSSQWLLLSALEFRVIAVDVIHNQEPEQFLKWHIWHTPAEVPSSPSCYRCDLCKADIFKLCTGAQKTWLTYTYTRHNFNRCAENPSVLNPNQIVDFLDFPFHIHFIFIYCNMHNADSKLHFFSK